MTDTPRDELNLDVIELWCDAVLADAKRPMPKQLTYWLCEYRADLPTHSIRSTVTSLVAEVRRLRAAAGVSVLSQDAEEK